MPPPCFTFGWGRICGSALISSSQQGTGIPGSRQVNLTVVGIGVVNTQVLQDSIDSGRTGLLLGTPALVGKFASCCASGMIDGLRLDGGSRYDTAVGREYQHLVATSPDISPSGSELYVYVTSAIEAQAQRAIRPEAIALGVFAVIAGLAALIIGTQSISRQLRAAADDAGVLRALGAGPGGDHGRWAAGHGGGGGRRGAACRCAGRRIVTVLAVRAGAGGGTWARDLPRLGGARAWVARASAPLGGVAAVSLTGRRRTGRRPATRSPSAARCAARVSLAARLPASAAEGLRLALDPGRGRTCGAGPLGHGRGGAGHGRSHRHADVRRQPDHAGFPSGTVRVELQLRLLRGPGLGRRARALGRPTAGP